MNNTDLIALVERMPKGLFGVVCETLTIPTMSQKKRGTNEVNPYYGRLTKFTHYTQIAIGYGYSQYANAQLTRRFGKPTKGNGMGDKNGGHYTDWNSLTEYPIFHSQPMKGKQWDDGKYALISHSINEPTKKYLRLTYKPNTIIKTTYFLDGVAVTDIETIKDIQRWDKPHQQKWIYGLDGIKVEVRDITLDNVMVLANGEKYNFSR